MAAALFLWQGRLSCQSARAAVGGAQLPRPASSRRSAVVTMSLDAAAVAAWPKADGVALHSLRKLPVLGAAACAAPPAAGAQAAKVPVSLGPVVCQVGGDLFRTNLADYESMRDDVQRTSKFQRAIERNLAARGDGAVVLDIGTGPFALLALMAARAGAQRVYAVEKSAEAAELARAAVQNAGFEGRVVIVEGDARQVDLPEKVDLIVSELIGNIATGEGVVDIIRDARRRFLKPGSQRPGLPSPLIPTRCQTMAAPFNFRYHEDLYRMRGAGSVKPLRAFSDSPDVRLLAAAQPLEEFVYGAHSGQAASDLQRPAKLSFLVPPAAANKLGGFSGFALWPRVVLDEAPEEALVVDVQGQPSHWAYILVFMAPEPFDIAAPGSIDLRPSANVTEVPYTYTFQAEVLR